MRVAKFLLLDDNLSISEIAQRTGYDNFGYFSTMFRGAIMASARARCAKG